MISVNKLSKTIQKFKKFSKQYLKKIPATSNTIAQEFFFSESRSLDSKAEEETFSNVA